MDVDPFLNANSALRLYEYGFATVHETEIKLLRWRDRLRVDIRREPHLVSYFIDENFQELSRMKDTCRNIVQLRQLYDQIFNGLLMWGQHGNRGHQITRLFKKFIKGITFFKNEEYGVNSVPIYHRLFSCGVGDDAFRQTSLQCKSGMTSKTWSDVKRQIEKCYIERLIYNDIFIHQMLHLPSIGTEEMSQNQNHMHRLELTRADFKTCFPKTDLSISIEYDSMNRIPLRLFIRRINHGKGKKSIEERYEKTLDRIIHANFTEYSNVVECRKSIVGGASFFKLQTFDRENPRWTAT